MSTTIESNSLMSALISSFPTDLIKAISIAGGVNFKTHSTDFNNVLICGMGGSGIGGKLVASWVQKEIKIPILFCQDYSIPNFVNEKTLIIASSNSGNTEETLIATEKGREKGAQIVGICSGGKLKDYCEKYGFNFIQVPGGAPPRTTLAYSLVQLLHILNSFELITNNHFIDIQKSQTILIEKAEEIKSRAKELAVFLEDKHLMIYSAAIDEPIAIRARQQFNENSKLLVGHHVIPEMNHNELLGWTGGNKKYGVLIIDSGKLNEKNYRRINFSIEFIRNKTPYILTLKSLGESKIERSLYLIHLIDWASYYYAVNNNIDSVEINVIEELKKVLD